MPPIFSSGSSFRIDADASLVLEDLWLGNPLGADPPVRRCGHRFR